MKIYSITEILEASNYILKRKRIKTLLQLRKIGKIHWILILKLKIFFQNHNTYLFKFI